jgi:hypothetical protein
MPGGDLTLNNTGVGRPVIVDKKGKLKALVKGDIYRQMSGENRRMTAELIDPARRMGGRRPVRVVGTPTGCVICLGELWRNFLRENPSA